jgi:hypothetical protein
MIEDYIHEFRASNGVHSKCRIRTFLPVSGLHKGDLVIICSQLLDDEAAGMSVTNAAETIASGVMHKHQVQPTRMVWIEHYPKKPAAKIEENFSRVTFMVAMGSTFARGPNFYTLASPNWNAVTREIVEHLIDSPFPEQ